jgi:hypothetical protein
MIPAVPGSTTGRFICNRLQMTCRRSLRRNACTDLKETTINAPDWLARLDGQSARMLARLGDDPKNRCSQTRPNNASDVTSRGRTASGALACRGDHRGGAAASGSNEITWLAIAPARGCRRRPARRDPRCLGCTCGCSHKTRSRRSISACWCRGSHISRPRE